MPKNGRIVVPSQTTGRYSPEDLEFAGESARLMVQQSKILQTALAAMIASRRVYMVARSALDNEVLKGWECEDPGLILHTLVLSAQEKANEKFQIADLHRQCLGTVVPFIDIVLQQSMDTGEDICGNTQPEGTIDDSSAPIESAPSISEAVDPAGPVLPGGEHESPA
jgi:hypothetical protein